MLLFLEGALCYACHKMTKMKKLVFALIVGSVAFASCQKDTDEDNQHNFSGNTVKGGSMEDLKVSSSFDWKTSQDVSFDIFSKRDAVIAIQSVEGGTYEKGFIRANSKYSSKITLPAGTEKVQLKFNNTIKEIELNSNSVSYIFE